MSAVDDLLSRKRQLDEKVRELNRLTGRGPRDAIAEHRGRALKSHRITSAQLRDIGPPPEIADAELRAKVQGDLEAFLRELFPDLFHWPFSHDQQRSIARLQQVATHGGLVLDAEPRGSGKTQRAIRGALWAILTGRRKYVPIICATAGHAKKIIRGLKIILTSPRLQRVFPAELHGFAQLDNQNRGSSTQLCQGKLTGISLGIDQVIFPRVPGSQAAECVMSAWGITGSIRGQFHTRSDNTVIRPDLVLLDDPQTKESARSAAQTQNRWEIIHSDVLGLCGPDTRIACASQVTIAEKHDLSERLLLDRRWQGERCKTILTWPKNISAWDTYFETYREYERLGKIEQINQVYLRDQAELEEACTLAWDHRVAAGDVSAIQTAMHKWHEMGPAGFAAEFQNEPIDETAESDAPHFRGLELKFTNLPRGVVPSWASWITLGIDVQKLLLMWVVTAWSNGFTGSVVDYGAFPQQSRAFYRRREAHPTLQSASGSSQDEGAWTWGLQKLTEELVGRRWKREGGGELSISKAVIDANGDASETVNEFCRRTPFAGVVVPAYGKGIEAGNMPMDQYAMKQGEQLGFHWLIRPSIKHAVRHLIHDTNFWKTFLARRAMAKAGETGSLSIFGDRPEQHHMFAQHLKAESCQRTYGRGREVWQWTGRPSDENDWLDCLVMSGVAASICGAALGGIGAARPPKPKVSFSDRQKKARGL